MTSTVWTPGTLDPDGWQQDPGGWYQHSAGIPWYQAALPGLWHRFTHRCRAHSVGVYGWDVMLRCICGAVREGITNPGSHYRQHPDQLDVHLTDGWRHRNSRYRHTALLFHPYVRTLEEM